MKSLLFYLSILTIVITGCQSDPCEEISCVNGSCNEGICECPPGFYGILCENQAQGMYALSAIASVDCPTDFPVLSTRATAPVRGERICFPFNNGEMCFWYRLDLETDFSFRTTFNQIAVGPSGTEALVSSDAPDGTYIVTQEGVILTFSNGSTQVLPIENNKLSWTIDQTRDEYPACRIELEMEKL